MSAGLADACCTGIGLGHQLLDIFHRTLAGRAGAAGQFTGAIFIVFADAVGPVGGAGPTPWMAGKVRVLVSKASTLSGTVLT